MRKNKGITLVALIVTIIILLLLAGITISQLTGSGLFEKTQLASEMYAEKSAREKLELELTNLVIEKQTNTQYNSNEYLTQKLEEKEFIVNDDIVIVDGYQFKINREVPEVLISLGKGNQTTDIKIIETQTVATDYNSSTIKIEIEYDGDLSIIELEGEKLYIPEKVDGKYTIEKDVTTNGNYSIYVTNTNNEYAFSNIKVTEISEDMAIKNVEDFVAFRERVNAGATYEGKTITVENDIDLSSVCYKVDGTAANDVSWTPIGTSTTPFKGIFDAKNKEIIGLYSNNNTNYQGLFGIINNGNVKNLKIKGNVGTSEKSYIGLLAGQVAGGKIENIDTLEGSTVLGTSYIGGLIGNTSSQIYDCSNNAVVIASGDRVRWNMWKCY